MHDQNEKRFWRGLSVALLAAGALPMAWAWRGQIAERLGKSDAPQVRDLAAFGSESDWVRPDQIAVQFKSGAKPEASSFASLGSQWGGRLSWNGESGGPLGTALLTLPFGTNVQAKLDALNRDPRVEAADVIHLYRIPQNERNAVSFPAFRRAQNENEPDKGKWKPNDPRYGEQWNFRMVKAEEAWGQTKGKGAVVAVIDTGVAYADTKKGKIARDFKNTKFVPGYDFVAKDALPNDDQGHGTHVAGTIAESTNNDEGVAGLAFEATVMPLKVLSASGSGTSADIADAIRWAADHGANVINMSLGSPYSDKLMKAACEYAKNKGVVIICAAGNSGREGVGYPAAYKDCVAISAVGPSGDLSFYSSWGKEVALAAPGGDTKAGGEAGAILQNTVFDGQDDYFGFQGTSMASPHAAAVAALIVASGVKDPDEIKAILQKSAQSKGTPKKYGAGVLDAAAAVTLAEKTHADGVARFWVTMGLFAGCALIGRIRLKQGPLAGGYPFWGTVAIAFGFLFPDWLVGYLGMTSEANLIGHSVLIPGILLMLGAKNAQERRLLGWAASGLVAHLGWELVRGTTPFGVEIGFWQFTPWVISNTLIGVGMLLSGLHAKREY